MQSKNTNRGRVARDSAHKDSSDNASPARYVVPLPAFSFAVRCCARRTSYFAQVLTLLLCTPYVVLCKDTNLCLTPLSFFYLLRNSSPPSFPFAPSHRNLHVQCTGNTAGSRPPYPVRPSLQSLPIFLYHEAFGEDIVVPFHLFFILSSAYSPIFFSTRGLVVWLFGSCIYPSHKAEMTDQILVNVCVRFSCVFYILPHAASYSHTFFFFTPHFTLHLLPSCPFPGDMHGVCKNSTRPNMLNEPLAKDGNNRESNNKEKHTASKRPYRKWRDRSLVLTHVV